MLVRAALGDRGYRIEEARDGDESLQIARQTNPDLIILDMLMPGRSGLEVLSELRTDPRFATTPVIMLTARTQPPDREAALQARADRFLAKPFSPRELAGAVDVLLESAGAGARSNGRHRERLRALARERVAWAESRTREGDTRALREEVTTERAREDLMIATVSHELRTPLTGISGLTEILLDHDLDAATRRKHLETIHAEVRRLARLIDTLLDLERLRDVGVRLRPTAFRLDELLRERAEVFSGESSAHTIALELPGGQLEVLADRDRIAQVVSNLLSNAIKYSPDGGTIRVRARCAERIVTVAVEDPGIGIPADQQGRVFSRFFRVDSRAARGIEGLGLGLALSREIVTAHGGDLRFESTEDKGSTFWFELPVR
jgi:signal transduction histidine kinase